MRMVYQYKNRNYATLRELTRIDAKTPLKYHNRKITESTFKEVKQL